MSARVEPLEDPSRPPQRKLAGSDAAATAAIKAALDEGRFERAAALLELLRPTGGAGQVVALEGRREAGLGPHRTTNHDETAPIALHGLLQRKSVNLSGIIQV